MSFPHIGRHIESAIEQGYNLSVRLRSDGRIQATVIGPDSPSLRHFDQIAESVEKALKGLNERLSHEYEPVIGSLP